MERNLKISLIALLLIQVLIGIAISSANPFIDEGQYISYAYYTYAGETPYLDFFSLHGPGTMYLWSFFFSIFGDSVFTARMVVLLVELMITVLLFTLARKMFDDQTAFLATAFYAFFMPVLHGLLAIIEPFMTLFSLITIYLLYTYFFDKKENKFLLGAGIALGLGILFRQSVILLIPFLILFIFMFNQEKKSLKKLWNELGIFIGGIAVFPILAAIFFALRGALNEFLYGVLFYNLTKGFIYNKMETGQGALGVINELHEFAVLGLVFAAVIFLFWKNYLLMKKRSKYFLKWNLLLLSVVALVSNLFPIYDELHLLPALPIFAILFGFWGVKVFEYLKLKKKELINYAVILVFVLFVLGISVFSINYYSSRLLVDGFGEINAVGNYIQSNTAENETIFSFPFHPYTYFVSKRPLATHYLYIAPWTAREEVKSGMLSSLQQSRPAYVVYYRNFSLEGQTPEQYAPEISQWI
ncbi:MAG: glycosyltransferase family 39 protein, partial [Candidatus Diapherotrites archaeon]